LRQHHITFTRHWVPHFTSHHYLSNTLNQPYHTNIHLYRFLSGAGEFIKTNWWGYRGQVVGKLQGQVVGISRSSGGGKFQGQVVGISRSTGGGNSKAEWWGYRGQLVGEIIKVKWWGYLGQVVGISRSSGGDIKVNWWGKLSRSSGGDIEVK
jgi:hypothetical protein